MQKRIHYDTVARVDTVEVSITTSNADVKVAILFPNTITNMATG